jgi:hypothetical protein
MDPDLKKAEKEWNEKWNKEFSKLCDTFLKKNIGHQDSLKGVPPVCYGTGDGRPWCLNCQYKKTC